MKQEEDRLWMDIVCLCGRDLQMEFAGGQYQNRWSGECECGRKWKLDEYSEELEEIGET